MECACYLYRVAFGGMEESCGFPSRQENGPLVRSAMMSLSLFLDVHALAFVASFFFCRRENRVALAVSGRPTRVKCSYFYLIYFIRLPRRVSVPLYKTCKPFRALFGLSPTHFQH